jgi:RNA polymerase sigma-70 factor (ECF subfamily)
LTPSPYSSEEALVAGLRAGDETAFAWLVDSLHGRLLALARTFTSSGALAEDIVQETWIAVIRGLGGFEGRSTLRTWIFQILVKRARSITVRESKRTNGFLPLDEPEEDSETGEWRPGMGRAGLWEKAPVSWGLEDPDSELRKWECLQVVQDALAKLPHLQRQVVLLRDVEDVPPEEICNILTLSETNQRVLLHRGRARIRRALDRYLRDGTRGEQGGSGRRGVEPTISAPAERKESRGL